MKKSIDIDEIIWAKANIEAEKRGISIDDLVKQALEVFLGMDTKKIWFHHKINNMRNDEYIYINIQQIDFYD